MGNHISKKNKGRNRRSRSNNRDTCMSHEMFSSGKIISEDRMVFDEREHAGHVIVKEVFKGLFSSPIHDILSDPNAKVLDVGCGSGFWLTDMAAEFPKPRYFGIDMLPVFPTSTVPNNVVFQQHNLLKGLPYGDNTFDFVHIQFLISDFTESQWENFVFQELTRVLKPGGWLEIGDPEYEFRNVGPIAKRISAAVHSYMRMRNADPLITRRYYSFLKSISSLSAINHEERPVPLSSNGNSDKIGALSGYYTSELCRDIARGPVPVGIMKKKSKGSNIVEELLREFETHRTFYYYHRFYTQKHNNSLYVNNKNPKGIMTQSYV